MMNPLEMENFKPYGIGNPAPWSAMSGYHVPKDLADVWNNQLATETVTNELSNKPRYDIDGRRYGNTLSDDMISIKNQGRVNTHTPESYNYWGHGTETALGLQPEDYHEVPVIDNKPVLNDQQILNGMYPGMLQDFRGRAVSRQKNVTGDSNDWWVDYEDEPLGFQDEWEPDAYLLTEYLKQRDYKDNQQTKYDLSTDNPWGNTVRDDMFAIKNGNWHDWGEQDIRYDAHWDPYLKELVNYNRLSPAQLTQLAKMGVNRPDVDYIDEYNNANSQLNDLMYLYQNLLEQGKIK